VNPLPPPPIDLNQKIRDILKHTTPLLPEADCPIKHFERSANDGISLLKYLEDHIDQRAVYPRVYARHFGQLQRMILGDMFGSFERFLKELAAACIDVLAPYTADDRFDQFFPKRAGQLSAFVSAGSLGKALCESDTWLNNRSINDRFRMLLKEPFGNAWESLFPERNQNPAAERERAATLAVLW
jgi:hypothetical protein